MKDDERAEKLERELEDMEHHSDEVQRDLDKAAQEWESHQQDESVPGAVTEETQTVTGADKDPAEDEDEG